MVRSMRPGMSVCPDIRRLVNIRTLLKTYFGRSPVGSAIRYDILPGPGAVEHTHTNTLILMDFSRIFLDSALCICYRCRSNQPPGIS
jgi:hypothetical protein